jgi:hypothetical protein
VSAVLLAVGPVAGCAESPNGRVANPDTSVSRGPATSSPLSPDPSPHPGTAGRGEDTRRPTAVEGGGYAAAVPGTDEPGRKAVVGPQYTVSEDVDIEEIERLVRAVERIARRQAVQEPTPVDGTVAAAVGTFTYRWFADGTVRPEPSWVAANIRTETVPILGSVTCHRVMLPQLRAALREVVARGLAGEVNADEYGGCYVPRFIARDPNQGLSLHTWGIAVDLNVPGNQRGTVGAINRDVVSIFKRWGFAWGGDWNYTDPMHFELARLVSPR